MSKKFETAENAVETTKRERALCYLKWAKTRGIAKFGQQNKPKNAKCVGSEVEELPKFQPAPNSHLAQRRLDEAQGELLQF